MRSIGGEAACSRVDGRDVVARCWLEAHALFGDDEQLAALSVGFAEGDFRRSPGFAEGNARTGKRDVKAQGAELFLLQVEGDGFCAVVGGFGPVAQLVAADAVDVHAGGQGEAEVEDTGS